MIFRYREIQLSDPDMAKAVLALAGTAFGHIGGLAGLQRLIQMPESNVEPLCLGAFYGDTLAGFLACTPHRFMYDNSPLLLYQPAWAVTGIAFRGKGIFTNLINTAEGILAPQGAGGMFASPNLLSGPVFTGPLGFKHAGRLLVAPVWRGYGLKDSRKTEEKAGCMRPVEGDLLAWQRRRLAGEAVYYHEDDRGNAIWGRKRTAKKMGIQVSYLLAGGLQVSNSGGLGRLMKELSGPSLRLFFLTNESRYRSFFKIIRPSSSLYLVWKSYDKNLPQHPSFDAMMGLFDHF